MGAVRVHHTDTTQADWDAATQVANLGDDYTKKDLKNVFAWIPDDANPTKSDSSLPHHLVSTAGKPGAADVSGCQSAIGVLNGAMGGADIPDDDRQGVWDHLAAHLKDADVVPAELKSAEEAAAIRALSAIAVAVAAGSMSIDEVREAEGMAPAVGGFVLPADAVALPTGCDYILDSDSAARMASGGFVPEPGNAVEIAIDVNGPVLSASDVKAAMNKATERLGRAYAHPRADEPERQEKGAPVTIDLSERATVKGVERRSTPFRGIELRDKPDGSGGSTLHFTGYACVTESAYEMEDWLGPFDEVVRAGAFKQTLSQNADVPFKINHEGLTLARTKSGTMRLSEDSTGLYVDADLDPGSPHVKSLRSAMDRGDVDEMSFAFWVVRQQWSPDFMQRDILEVNINKGDVSVVNYGANPATAGASLRGKALLDHMRLLSTSERRDLMDRLLAEFHPQAPDPGALLLADAAAMRAWVAERAAELREGKQFSSATMDVLSQVLDLIAAADESVDAAQPMLADLMGVANPDADDADDPDGDDPDGGNDDGGDDGQDSGGDAPQANSLPLAAAKKRLRALELSAA